MLKLREYTIPAVVEVWGKVVVCLKKKQTTATNVQLVPGSRWTFVVYAQRAILGFR